MIRVENLRKRFGEIRAVDGIGFEVGKGEIYGLLGPNGAGKTTTLSMICGLLAADEGRILFEGTDLAIDPIGVRSQLGVVPQEVALYQELTARENVRFWGGLYGLSGRALKEATEKALASVGLTERADDTVKGYSGGMKRRLNLALGLVHGPKAVLLDEPTVGIDPQARQNILDVVRAVANAGAAVLYTTHYLEEAERICDRIGIMDHGKILAEGTLEQLKKLVGGEEIITVSGEFSATDAREKLSNVAGARVVAAEDGRLILAVAGAASDAAAALGAIYGANLGISAVSVQPPSLNSLFLKLTGRGLRD